MIRTLKILFILQCLLFIAIGTSSCKNKKSDPIETIETVELPNDFVTFYERFMSDSLYQINHIIFPLEGIPAMVDSTMDITNYKWYNKGWVTHKKFNDYNGTYVREFSNFKDIITEQIYDKGHKFGMKRRYAIIGGEWNLIFYAAMNPIK